MRIMAVMARISYSRRPFSTLISQNNHEFPLHSFHQSLYSWSRGIRAASCSFMSTSSAAAKNDTTPQHERRPNEESWRTMLKELQKFVQNHNHARVPEKWHENPALARWVAYNRSRFRAGMLENERIQQLEALGMVWNPYETDWNERFAELTQFHKEHGHCRVPQTSSELGRWCVGQRFQYRRFLQGKPSHMTEERIRQLNDIGFEWEPLDTIWMNHYRDLCDFRRDYGHCFVLREYEELYRWVEANRYQYRKMKDGRHPCSMTPERVELLEQIDGFVWDARDALWYERLLELKEYTSVNGLGQVPPVKTHGSLRAWLCRQMKLWDEKKEGKQVSLTEKRAAELKRLGFLLD